MGSNSRSLSCGANNPAERIFSVYVQGSPAPTRRPSELVGRMGLSRSCRSPLFRSCVDPECQAKRANLVEGLLFSMYHPLRESRRGDLEVLRARQRFNEVPGERLRADQTAQDLSANRGIRIGVATGRDKGVEDIFERPRAALLCREDRQGNTLDDISRLSEALRYVTNLGATETGDLNEPISHSAVWQGRRDIGNQLTRLR